MLIATWNVNSVRARLPRLVPWLEERRPDVVLLQELKCTDDQFPYAEIEAAGYNAEVFGQKSYNGVAVLAKHPIEDVVRGFGDERFDDEARVISAAVQDTLVVGLYAVNGQSVGAERYDFKLSWFDRLREFLAAYDMTEKVVVTGDFNITFDDRDVYDPEKWRERILCSTPEREALAAVTDLGFHDALRRHHEEGEIYTWWDYRTRGFERGNRGLRIDHFLMSTPALEACTDVTVDLEARKGPKPSDHAPVLAALEDSSARISAR